MTTQDGLQQQVDRLDSLVARDGAFMRLHADGEGGALYGNQSGYLRFGIEVLRAALRPSITAGQHRRIQVDADYLFGAESDFVDYTPYLVESAPKREQPTEPRGYGLGWLMFAGICILVALAAIGATTVWKWIF